MPNSQNEREMAAQPRDSSMDDRDRPLRDEEEIRGVGDSGESDEESEDTEDLDEEEEEEEGSF
jgi:hypothetical protein